MKRWLYASTVGSNGSLALLVLRVVCGAAFMLHGWGKIQNPMGWMGPDAKVPPALQALAAISEFGGGAAWILGLLTPLASLGILCTMAVAAWTHWSKGGPFVGQGGYELPLVYLSVAVVLLLVGPGRFSLDARLFGGSPRRARITRP